MKYGLKTIQDGIIFTSYSLDMVLEQMETYPDAFIVEIEDKPNKQKNYSEDFYNELR